MSICMFFFIMRGISVGLHATRAAQARSTTFLASVSPLVSLMASPKQPQSLTGLSTKIHTVRAVMTAMNASVSLLTTRRQMARSMSIPIQNSTALSATEAARVAQSGMAPATPMASA